MTRERCEELLRAFEERVLTRSEQLELLLGLQEELRASRCLTEAVRSLREDLKKATAKEGRS